MVSFKSLFFVAASALAVLASPFPSDSGSVAVLPARDLAVENTPALVSRGGSPPVCSGGCGSVPDVIAEISAVVDVQVGIIEDACHGTPEIDVVVEAILKIKVAIDEGYGHIKGLGGKIDVNIFVQIFVKIVIVLKVAYDACGALEIITQIQISIAVFIKACFSIFGEAYYKDFCGRLGGDVVGILRVLNCEQLIAIIKVHLSVNLLGLLGINVGVGIGL